MLTSGIHINREYVSESMYSLTLNKLNTLIFRSSEKEKLRSIKYPLNQTDRNLKFFLSISSSRELKIHLFPLKKKPIHISLTNLSSFLQLHVIYIYLRTNVNSIPKQFVETIFGETEATFLPRRRDRSNHCVTCAKTATDSNNV